MEENFERPNKGNTVPNASLPYGAMAFHRWMVEKGWHEHSSKEYFYRSENFHQWPPDQTATGDELLKMFFLR